MLLLSYIQVFDEVLLAKGANCHARTKGLIFIWQRLEKDERHALKVILNDRARIQQLIRVYLEVKLMHPSVAQQSCGRTRNIVCCCCCN